MQSVQKRDKNNSKKIVIFWTFCSVVWYNVADVTTAEVLRGLGTKV